VPLELAATPLPVSGPLLPPQPICVAPNITLSSSASSDESLLDAFLSLPIVPPERVLRPRQAVMVG
jgi:hypothetical protein